MDDIRQESFNEGPNLKLNKIFKKTLLNKESMAFQALKK